MQHLMADNCGSDLLHMLHVVRPVVLLHMLHSVAMRCRRPGAPLDMQLVRRPATGSLLHMLHSVAMQIRQPGVLLHMQHVVATPCLWHLDEILRQHVVVQCRPCSTSDR